MAGRRTTRLYVVTTRATTFTSIRLYSVGRDLCRILRTLNNNKVTTIESVRPTINMTILLRFRRSTFRHAVLAANLTRGVRLSNLAYLSSSPSTRRPHRDDGDELRTTVTNRVNRQLRQRRRVNILIMTRRLFASLIGLLTLDRRVPRVLNRRTLLQTNKGTIRRRRPLTKILLLMFLNNRLNNVMTTKRNAHSNSNVRLINSLMNNRPVTSIKTKDQNLTLVNARNLNRTRNVRYTIIRVFNVINSSLRKGTFGVRTLRNMRTNKKVRGSLNIRGRLSPFQQREVPRFFLLFRSLCRFFGALSAIFSGCFGDFRFPISRVSGA